MNHKKRNTIITGVILILILISATIYFFLNYSAKETELTILEKKWIADHTNEVIDVNVYNDIPVYGYNGSGIIFDYLDYITEKYQINFNKISYYTTNEPQDSQTAFLVLDSDKELGNHDLLMEEDNYVVISAKDKKTINLGEVDQIGILKSDETIAKQYFGDISMIVYEDIEKLVAGLNQEECSYAVIPNMSYMNEILTNDYHIVYHIEDLKKKLILRVADDTLYTILQKSYSEYYNQNYTEDYSKNYLSTYFKSTNTSDLEKKNYNAQTYKYGYVINMPYENGINNQFVGTISNYLSDFEKKANVEIEVFLYSSIDELKNALVSGKIDFAFGNFDYENLNMESMETSTAAVLNYVVLSMDNNRVNSIKGLTNTQVSVIANSKLYTLLADNGIKTKKYSNTDDLLRGIDNQSVIIVDKETYLYYKDNKLKDYKIIVEDTIQDGYKFLMNKKNTTFNQLFDYYISTMNYQNIRYQYQTNITLDKDYTTIKIIGFMIALVFFLVATIILINRKNVTNTVISKEEKLKYIDPMTSLKNRSYLNVNIYKWDDNVIFPQSVIVLDVNRLKEVNDKLGREAGDAIINKVASILINNQLENTDIIRSGGDEFLIYMVGYEEKQVTEYIKKLSRDMKNIPNCFGVEIGYSMILDEVKTVDDAINEAIVMMSKTKEKKKGKEEKLV